MSKRRSQTPNHIPLAPLAAFGAHGPAIRLPGGQGKAYRVGEIVLKPSDDAEESRWTAELFERLAGPGFQVPKPVRSAGGEWVVDGWCAWRRFHGRHVAGRWKDKVAACECFHAALVGESPPGFFASREDPWAIADRMAWEEEPIECLAETRAYVERLVPCLEPSSVPNQVIHGDIAGNILFAPGEAPCVIDFAPYWRPADFALGVLVVDAITWEKGPLSLVESCRLPRSVLARAALRRILEHDLHHRLRGRDTLAALPHYEKFIGALGPLRTLG